MDWLSVGGVRFWVTCSENIVFRRNTPSYEPFLNIPTPDPSATCVEVRLEISTVPPHPEEFTRKASVGPWSVVPADEGYEIRSNITHGGAEPLWSARLNKKLDVVTVFLDPSLVVEEGGILTVPNPIHYPLDQVVLMYVLARRGGALVHAAGAVIAGTAVVFPGRSGAGKSTISRDLVRSPHIQMLSDDRVVLRHRDGETRAFGTPWPGEAGIAVNSRASLGGLLFLEQSLENRLEELSPRAAFERLLPVTSIPWYDPDIMGALLGSLERFTERTPSHVLHFRPGPEVVEVVEDFVARL